MSFFVIVVKYRYMVKMYNTLSQEKDSLTDKKINFFVCGPTVYDYAHIGHARTYVFFDSFVKYLRSLKYEVFYLQNITDIDDKIIKRALEEKKSSFVLAKKFEEEYLHDSKDLKIDSIDKYARATEHIEEIISQTKRLLEKDFAYLADDGIYYNISKFKEYGKLSKRTTKQAEDGTSRIDESVKKKNKGDFCIWKFSKEDEPKWKSPWGEGRPGWHIEDTAISEKYFGMQYDIHGGARDLMFPHHEAEIALMEAISGKKPFVRHWIHTGFLTVKGEKMSKSLGNFITIREFIKNHSPRILRFLVLKSHYRSAIDYEENKIKQIEQELRKIDQFVCFVEEKESTSENKELIEEYRKKINEALQDDFNTPVAIASLFSFISKASLKMEEINKKEVKSFLKELDSIFGFILAPKEERLYHSVDSYLMDEDLKKLVEERKQAKEKQDFRKADEIRKKIEDKGYKIEDTKQGYKIKKK